MKCSLKFKIVLFTTIFILFSFISRFLSKLKTYSNSDDYHSDDSNLPYILWWTPFTGLNHNIRKCSYGTCVFTENRTVTWRNKTKAILFYGSDFKIEDLPLPRMSWQWWALLHEESPKNQPIFNHEYALALFNLTSTFRLASGMPLTLQYLQSIESLISLEYYVPSDEKFCLLKEGKTSPVIYIQSDCNSPSKRDKYIEELSQFISIDSYGKCLNNQKLPSHLQGIEFMNHPEIFQLIAKYQFTIAFENSACEDYMTEKLWRPLIVGSVPIYWGSPSVKKWLPNQNSIVHVRDFETPQELASHLFDIMGNTTHYENFLEHKLLRKVSNTNLVSTLGQRSWGINEEQLTKGTFVEAFECYVCNQVHQFHETLQSGSLVANHSHYGCPVPQNMLSDAEENKSSWVEQWHKAETEAEVLWYMVNKKPGNFTMNSFYERVFGILKNKGHFDRFYQEEL